MQALEVRRVPTSADLEKPGDFAFIKKREPLSTKDETSIEPPKNRIKRFFWNMFGTKVRVTETLLPLWPPRDTVIVICPNCFQPLATTDRHTIVSLEPLTIEPELTCPYCRTKSFSIEEGKIIPIVFHAT
jgi:uncharacterized protein YbaR (Trm112 family)